ncbi:MAG: hypothetical protein M3Z85_01050 [Acidobacteriota bacterium]|nr:hypothetical protein [Acidobacteriota bacterium]
MARGKAGQNTISVEDLEMALVGYRMKQQELEERIREMRGRGDGRGSGRTARAKEASQAGPKNGRKRTLSASARKRIAVAQKKRWAEHRKKLGQAAKAE